ncbi:MarR family transcriptional regulator [Nonomuraea solani]|nr:MarR family transcriptional regulator [Nonomuraea solani]
MAQRGRAARLTHVRHGGPLSEAPDRTLRMAELAKWTRSKPSRVSHAVNKLEQAGWVRREHYAADRRG